MKGVVELFPTALFVSEHFALEESERTVLLDRTWNPNRLGNRSSEDTYALEHSGLCRMKAFLEAQTAHFAHEVLGLPRSLDVAITQSWLNHNPPGSSHHPHFHPNSIISGVFFIQGSECPLTVHRENLLFGSISLPGGKRTAYNATRRRISNREGHAVLFPSSLRHEVESNASGSDRYSLSFNTFVKGTIGSKERLTELVL